MLSKWVSMFAGIPIARDSEFLLGLMRREEIKFELFYEFRPEACPDAGNAKTWSVTNIGTIYTVGT